MNKFTAQELADFYQQVADGGVPEFNLGAGGAGPSLLSRKGNWRIKPKKKVIDLSVFIESGIDCEFGHDGGCWPVIGPLVGITPELLDGAIQYRSRYQFFPKCQPRTNHTHYWGGGECPLPEGFIVTLVKRWGRDEQTYLYRNLSWSQEGDDEDIIGFEVLGLAEGYCYPWEVSDE